MTSRPFFISLETHGREYRNPFMPQINQWMTENGYVEAFKGATDTYYLRL